MPNDSRTAITEGVAILGAATAGLAGIPFFLSAAKGGPLVALAVPFAILWFSGWFRYGMFRSAEIASITVLTVVAMTASLRYVANEVGDGWVPPALSVLATVGIFTLCVGFGFSAAWAFGERDRDGAARDA